jgi:hypothetical protein
MMKKGDEMQMSRGRKKEKKKMYEERKGGVKIW